MRLSRCADYIPAAEALLRLELERCEMEYGLEHLSLLNPAYLLEKQGESARRF